MILVVALPLLWFGKRLRLGMGCPIQSGHYKSTCCALVLKVPLEAWASKSNIRIVGINKLGTGYDWLWGLVSIFRKFSIIITG